MFKLEHIFEEAREREAAAAAERVSVHVLF